MFEPLRAFPDTTVTWTTSLVDRDFDTTDSGLDEWLVEDGIILAALGARFAIDGLVGRGCTSRIYRATDRDTGETVALKVPKPAWRGDAAAVFAREARIATRLRSSPRVVPLRGTYDAAKTRVLVFAWMAGGDLGSLPPPGEVGAAGLAERVGLILEAALALEAVHAERVVHGDVSPRNLFRDASGVVRIGDFGAAWYPDDLAAASSRDRFLGTPGFFAPEVLGGKRPDLRADIYALGATGFWILSGETVVPEKDFREIRRAQREVPPPRLREVVSDAPAALDRLLAKMLAPRPIERPGCVAAVREGLEEVVGSSM